MQANLGEEWTILFIAGKTKFTSITTIRIPVTARRLEDTLFATFTRPPIRIFDCWEGSITLFITQGVIHVSAVITQGLSQGAAGQAIVYTTVTVA